MPDNLIVSTQHCDVKPDNFVLSSFRCAGNFFSEVPFSEVMLVDFGRAIDLEQCSSNPEDCQCPMFSGEACKKEMQCPAMREGRSWSSDIDTFGILCSAHVLLFGELMQIKKDGKQWRPTSWLRRYYNRPLWGKIFNSLLDLDEGSGVALGSRPQNLRALRGMIDEYLETKRSHLKGELVRLENLLPKSRDDL